VSRAVSEGLRLSAATSTFQEAKHHLGFVLAKRADVPGYVFDRVYTTGSDLESAAQVLLREHLQAEAAVERFMTSDVGLMAFPEARQLETAFKSVFLWCSAYHDALCAGMQALRGERVGAYTSMNDALKPGKPVEQLLAERLPDYAPWFRKWRGLRNKMKLGVAFETVFDSPPTHVTAIRFRYPRRRDTVDVGDGEVSFESVFDALEMSAALSDLVRELAGPTAVA
jgi:hypothetical protein